MGDLNDCRDLKSNAFYHKTVFVFLKDKVFCCTNIYQIHPLTDGIFNLGTENCTWKILTVVNC